MKNLSGALLALTVIVALTALIPYLALPNNPSETALAQNGDAAFFLEAEEVGRSIQINEEFSASLREGLNQIEEDEDWVLPDIEGEIEDANELVSVISQGIQAIKAKNWALFTSLLTFALLFIGKLTKLWKKIGKKYAYIAVFVLALTGTITSAVAEGLSITQAIFVGLTAPGIASLFQAFEHGVLGREHSTAVNKSNQVTVSDKTKTVTIS